MSGRAYLLVLGDREGLGWVIANSRMAFSARQVQAAGRLAAGDRLLLYATRGCFHNPTRDRGRIFGLASVASDLVELDPPVELAGRQFATACDLLIEGLTPFRTGLELAPLVPSLRVFPKPAAWSGRLRRTLLELPEDDARMLTRRVVPLLLAPGSVRGTYLAATRG
jgi:hypothetical protein